LIFSHLYATHEETRGMLRRFLNEMQDLWQRRETGFGRSSLPSDQPVTAFERAAV